MCNPLIAIAAAQTAISAAGKVAGYIGQKQAYSANVAAANLNYGQRINSLSSEGMQVSERASEDSLSATIARLQAAGRISASASDLGAGAQQTIAAQTGDFFGIGRDEAVKQLNTQSAYNQLSNEAIGADLQRQSQINSVAKPNGLSLILGLGQSAIQGATTYGQLGGSLTGGGGTAGESAAGDAG